jgi:predicted secreted protein
MTAQKGKDLLLKVDADGEGNFTTVAGLRARSLAHNAATVDITDQESAERWPEPSPGVTSAPRASLLRGHGEVADVGGGFRKLRGELIGVAEMPNLSGS